MSHAAKLKAIKADIRPAMLRHVATDLMSAIKEDLAVRKEWNKQRRAGLRMLGYKPKPLTQAQKLKAIKANMRRHGYHPAPRYGKGEWVHSDCTMRTVKFDPSLGWYWTPSISWTLLCRSVRRDVAARK